jgi:hypothetical protein
MLASLKKDYTDRLLAFDIGDRDIAALRAQRDRMEDRLPSLLDQLDRLSSAGQRAAEALSDPLFRQRRDSYWSFITCGDLGIPLLEATLAFARMAYARGVPSRVFAIKASFGARVLVDGLFGKAGFQPGTP